MATLAQAAIDSTKRTFDIDVHKEIQRIKDELNIKSIGYPAFFAGIRTDLRKKVNPNIVCPMNCVYKMKNKSVHTDSVIPNNEFFVYHKNRVDYKRSKRVEKMIEDYSLEVFRMKVSDDMDTSDYLLLRTDYEDLLQALRQTALSRNYLGLTSWLINRALMMNPNTKSHKGSINTKLSKNRPLLLKILYDMSPNNFKKCFKSIEDVTKTDSVGN